MNGKHLCNLFVRFPIEGFMKLQCNAVGENLRNSHTEMTFSSSSSSHFTLQSTVSLAGESLYTTTLGQKFAKLPASSCC